MPRTPERLHGPASLSNAAATKYTVPGATRTVVREILVSNPSGSDATFTLSVGTDATGTRLYDAYNIPTGTVRTFYHYIVLETTEIIQAFGGTNNALKLTINGDEITEEIGVRSAPVGERMRAS